MKSGDSINFADKYGFKRKIVFNFEWDEKCNF